MSGPDTWISRIWYFLFPSCLDDATTGNLDGQVAIGLAAAGEYFSGRNKGYWLGGIGYLTIDQIDLATAAKPFTALVLDHNVLLFKGFEQGQLFARDKTEPVQNFYDVCHAYVPCQACWPGSRKVCFTGRNC